MRKESYGRLFLRFLRFGLLAWGGPVAQIAMIRQELVEEEKWLPSERFNRVLAVYQALPGPEAHELCVYFGMLKGGRLGGLLAGLGFMLPGFGLMLALSWGYARFGLAFPLFATLFTGCQAAVAALICRAAGRIGQHALTDPLLWGIAIFSGIAQLLNLHFLLILVSAGAIYLFLRQFRLLELLLIGAALLLVMVLYSQHLLVSRLAAAASPSINPSSKLLFVSGLRAGLLTFGGAYTAVPFLQHDAVEIGQWMTNRQFLDGLALSGILPVPFIIFSTFVGYLGGGFLGALLVTTGIFLPAFGFTLIGYEAVERLVAHQKLHAFLDGITAGVVGLIAVTALRFLRTAVTDLPTLSIFGLALLVLYRWKAKSAVAVVMVGAGALGFFLFR